MFLNFDRKGISNRTTPGFIYFIQAEVGGAVKIGWATSPQNRMAQMQAHGPLILKLLHHEPGNGKQERDLHARFASLRLHGEWFEAGADLMAYIEQRRGLNDVPVYESAPVKPYIFKGRKPPPPGRPRQNAKSPEDFSSEAFRSTNMDEV